MFLQRSAVAVVRRAAVAPVLRRSIATTAVRRKFLSLIDGTNKSREKPTGTGRTTKCRASSTGAFPTPTHANGFELF